MNHAPRWRGLLAPALLAALTLALFRPVLGHELLMFDDDINFYNNPHLGQFTYARVAWAFHDDTFMPRYMPLGWLQLMAAFELGGLGRGAFHVFNLVLHAANAALFLLVLRRLLARVAPTYGGSELCAGLLAAVWAVHPLRVEPVAWATGVHYVHATTWALLAVWLWLGCSAGKARRGLAVFCFACSGLVYPVALGLPAALLALGLWERRGQAGTIRDLAVELAPWFVVAALVLGANFWARFAVPGIYAPAPALTDFDLWERLGQGARSLASYLWRPLWPGEVTAVRNEVFRPPGLSLRDLPAALLLAAWLVASLALARRGRFGALLFCGAFASVALPYLGLLESPFQASDRYTYFPSLMWCAGLASVLAEARADWRRVLSGAMGLGVLSLAGSSAVALSSWQESPVFFERVAARLERPEVAADYRGRAAIFLARRGDYKRAEAILADMAADGVSSGVLGRTSDEVHALRGQAFAPTALPLPAGGVAADARAALALARVAARAGEARGAERRFRYALVLAPEFHDARHDLVVLLAALGRREEAETELARLPEGVLNEARSRVLRAFLIGGGAPSAPDS
jgi:protein O-mannosyl-transferase